MVPKASREINLKIQHDMVSTFLRSAEMAYRIRKPELEESYAFATSNLLAIRLQICRSRDTDITELEDEEFVLLDEIAGLRRDANTLQAKYDRDIIELGSELRQIEADIRHEQQERLSKAQYTL